MAIDFKQIRKVRDMNVNRGDRIVYSADFNATQRVDDELQDIRRLADAGAIIFILAHQGRYKDGSARSFDRTAYELSARLQQQVLFSRSSSELSLNRGEELMFGDVVLMENVRLNADEEKNDPELARRYARLGRKVVIGGFGKAHRCESSNHGILEHLPAWLATNHELEMAKITPWAGLDDESRTVVIGPDMKRKPYSVAVLGGVKKEKILDGLAGFVENYDYIIPGGIVLNTILKTRGINIGNSVIDDDGKTFEKQTEIILNTPEKKDKVYIPDKVRILVKDECGAERCVNAAPSSLNDYKDFRIVDFYINGRASYFLDKVAMDGGRIVLAGTPGMFKQGYTVATQKVLDYMNRESVRALALGGDTAGEIKGSGIPLRFRTSNGGGSALYFLARGTTPVYEALKVNNSRFAED